VSYAQHHRDHQSRKSRVYVALPRPLALLPHPPPCCAAGITSSSVHGVHTLPAPFQPLQQPWPLALLRASINDIREGDDGNIIVFGAPFATSPASPPRSARSSSGDAGGRCCCYHFEAGSGVVRHFGPSSSSPSELSASWSFLSLFAPLLFAKRERARAALIALRQRAHGSKFSCRLQRSCLIGAAKVLSHVCDSACSAVRRRAGSGSRTARMKFLAVM